MPLAAAWDWLDAAAVAGAGAAAGERVPIGQAHGRVTAAPVASPVDMPERDRAGCDGFAVVAGHTEGASLYSPVPVAAALILAGMALPNQTNAVLDSAGFDPAAGTALTPIAPGDGVIRRAEQLRAGDPALPTGRVLRPQDLALLTALGVATIVVVRTPRILLRVAGPKAGADTLTALLTGLLAQDGGHTRIGADLAEAAGADLILLAGRSGSGADDTASATLQAAGGRLDLHGIAIHPGGSSGLGWLGAVPVVLLPGEPLACWAAYTMLVSRLARRLAGLPWPSGQPITARLRRKIVSAIGVTDLARVTLDGDEATPLGGLESAGLAGLARADGCVLVPEASEGFGPGSTVTVHDCRSAG